VTAQSPQEVLEAVRRLEADLAAIRSRARERERDLSDLRADIAADSARERQSLVEDMERLVELIGASWRSTHDQIAGLAQEVKELRRYAEDTVGGLRVARMEFRFEPANGS
jgi:multidrug resistance efflux pump